MGGTRLMEHYSSFTARRKAVRYLRPVGRPYGLFTARRKVVRFTLRTVSRTYGPLKVLFKRQPRRHLGRDPLWISYIFLLCFTVLLE